MWFVVWVRVLGFGFIVFWLCVLGLWSGVFGFLPPPTCSVSILSMMTWAYRPHGVRTRGKKKSLASKFPQESSRFVGAIVSLSHSLSIECLSYLYVTCMAHPGDLILPCGRKEGVRMRLSIRLPGLVFFIRRIAPRKTGMEYVSRGHC